LVRDELGDSTFERENRAVRDVARPLSEVRDAKVLIERLDALNDQFKGRLNSENVANLKEHLVARRRAARTRLIGSADTIPKIVRDSLAVKKRVKRWPLCRRGWRAMEDGLRKVYRQGRDAMGNARAQPTAEALHEWRKRAKDLQYELQLLRDIQPSAMKALADRTHRLTDLLGEDHDLAVMRGVVKEASKRGVCIDAEALTALIDQRRGALQMRAFALGERVYEHKTRKFLRRLERYWKRSR